MNGFEGTVGAVDPVWTFQTIADFSDADSKQSAKARNTHSYC